MNRAVYVVGVPGSGKSTAVRGALAHLFPLDSKGMVPHIKYASNVTGLVEAVELGASHRVFPGTDRLSMSVEPRAIEFVTKVAPSWDVPLIAEGDRLATRGFLAALDASFDLTLVLVDVDDATAATRRATRVQSGGTAPKDAWLRGRRTKVDNLVAWFGGDLVRLDGTAPTADLAATIRSVLGV